MNERQARAAIQRILDSETHPAGYRGRCEGVRRSGADRTVWEAFVQYFPPGSDLPLDGPVFLFMSDLGELVQDPETKS